MNSFKRRLKHCYQELIEMRLRDGGLWCMLLHQRV